MSFIAITSNHRLNRRLVQARLTAGAALLIRDGIPLHPLAKVDRLLQTERPFRARGIHETAARSFFLVPDVVRQRSGGVVGLAPDKVTFLASPESLKAQIAIGAFRELAKLHLVASDLGSNRVRAFLFRLGRQAGH